MLSEHGFFTYKEYLLDFYFFFILVEESKLCEMVVCIGNNIDLLFIFFSPLSDFLIPHKTLG
jgi:hypothetical protein